MRRYYASALIFAFVLGACGAGDTFSYIPAGENAAGIAGITFAALTGATHATKLTIENLNEDGLGTFRAAAR